MKFYLGTHMVNWLELVDVPLFVSRRRLLKKGTDQLRARLPQPIGEWALDSGAFSELSEPPHRFTFSADDYIRDVRRIADEMPGLQWAAPMDWMCEPFILAKTGWDVETHQRLTVANFQYLRAELGPLVIPVLQGWSVDDYLRCWEMYHEIGVDLEWEPTIGVGSVCRRHNTQEAARIFRTLADQLTGTQLHGFGVKTDGLYAYGDCLASADSMAWSSRGRRSRLRGCTHKSCGNCLRFALRWRDRLLNERLAQQRIEV